MTQYVCGFLFDPTEQRVCLIQKRKPAWQAGFLNGVGGKIEPTDASPEAAMQREFKEEAGLDIDQWHRFCTLGSQQVLDPKLDQQGWRVMFFYAYGNVEAATTKTSEYIIVYDVNALPPHCMPNLRWLIPMALAVKHDRAQAYEIGEVPR